MVDSGIEKELILSLLDCKNYDEMFTEMFFKLLRAKMGYVFREKYFVISFPESYTYFHALLQERGLLTDHCVIRRGQRKRPVNYMIIYEFFTDFQNQIIEDSEGTYQQNTRVIGNPIITIKYDSTWLNPTLYDAEQVEKTINRALNSFEVANFTTNYKDFSKYTKVNMLDMDKNKLYEVPRISYPSFKFLSNIPIDHAELGIP
jgi:hypothetical protein